MKFKRYYIYIAAIYAVGVSALGALVWVLGSIFVNGLPVVLKYGTELFTANFPPPILFAFGFGPPPKVGLAPAIVGTLLVVAIALTISVPLGFVAGVVISELRFTRWAELVENVASTLVEAPTITAGIAVYWLLVIPMHTQSALAGGVALSLIMLPYIAIYTAETYKKVPTIIKEGGLALGFKYTTVLFRILRGLTLPGVLSGILLAFAKGAGEAAPLLFTAGWDDKVNWNPLKPVPTLSVLIYKYGMSPSDLWIQLSWAASFILVFMIILPLIVVSKVVVKRHEI